MCDSTGHDDPTTYDQPPNNIGPMADHHRRGLPNVMRELKAAGMVRRDPYGTGQGIHVGSQVVVAGQGMGTVTRLECFAGIHNADTVYEVRIEGDRIPFCYPRELVTLYADIYAGITDYPHG